MASPTAKTRKSRKPGSRKSSGQRKTKTAKADSWLAAGFSAPYSSLKMGDVIGGRWQIKRKLGEGGMGTVWEAQHLINGRKAAVKVMMLNGAQDPLAVKMFEREGEVDNIVDRAAGRMPRAGAVEVYDSGTLEDGAPYMVMEVLDGDDLEGLFRKGKLTSYGDILEAADSALHVLEGAHSKGIIHRDLKPANIFREKDGGVRVLDWGLSSKRGTSDFQPGTVLGTPGFMAPEQAQGESNKAGPEADIYGLSATLYSLITGRPPSDTVDDTRQCRITRIEEVAPAVPAYLAGVINKGLGCNPKDRFRSATEMRAALQPLLDAMRTQQDYPHVEEAVQAQLRRTGL